MKTLNRFTKYQAFLQSWGKIVGPAEQFPLEHRVYNTFCLITLLAVGYNIPFNYAVGLYWSSFLSAFMMVVLGLAYYLSRFKQKHQISFIVASATVNVVFGVNYFFNAGINGPTLLLLALSYFPILAVSPAKQYGIWTATNFFLAFGIVGWEYFQPESVSGQYLSRESQFVDMISSYLIVFLLIRVCTVYMINSYKEARAEAEQAAKDLQRLNQDKNKLFSIVSHDLRAPLSNIKGYLEILAKSDLPHQRREEIEDHLLHATQNTLEMLTNLLSWSKNQMDGVDKDFSPLPVRTLLAPTIDLFSDIARGKGITLENNLDDRVWVNGDADMLQLIFRNLINNAIKFTSPGGQITLSSVTTQSSAIFSVTDSGTGEPVTLPPDVFELKGSSTYGTQREKGVGLGLVLCREFAEAMHGEIWFVNHPETGTTFQLRMPLATASMVKEKPMMEFVSV